MTFIQYRGQVTDSFIKKLKCSEAPIQPIITLKKLKTTMPSLKGSTKKALSSQVSCPGCEARYVGQTRRYLITRLREHKNAITGAV